MSGEGCWKAARYRIALLLVTIFNLVFVSVSTAQTLDTCPCSLWNSSATPTTIDGGDGAATELGLRFRSDVQGYVTGIRFYKAVANTGVHPVSLWTNGGTLLATGTSASETSSGWQQVDFATPVAIEANTTYVASYFAPNGHYAFDANAFVATGADNGLLHALVNGADGANGIYRYSASSTFPDQSFQSTNYWVDVVFIRTDAAGNPRVLTVTPARGSTGIGVTPTVTASFTKPMNPATLDSATFVLADVSANPVTTMISYDPSTNTATLTPTYKLLFSSAYSVTVKGGPSGVRDTDGNAMSADVGWIFTTGGGPILVVSSQANPFTKYYAEILQAEGLNEFTVADVSTVTSSTLTDYTVVILGEMPLTSEQVGMLGDWVSRGGNLVAMHPDSQLAGLLGLSALGSSLSDQYIQIQTNLGPGVGIVGQPIQFHGLADRYMLNGATSLATLFSDATTPTESPAVTVMKVGSGRAAAFMYDLARSVVYTRQGNPSWAGQERVALPPIRPSDLFFGNAPSDLQPDWNNLANVQIPIADEQQRLLVNLVESMAAATGPLPRFWYLPSGFKAAVVMTGDDHNQGGTPGRFDTYLADSAPNCSVADWQCVRSTAYVWNATPITDQQAAAYVAQGFELAPHVDSDPTCSDWTYPDLFNDYTVLMATFAANWPSVPTPQTHRMHCISWSDYDSQPLVELAHGIRLDTSYYYFPDTFAQGRTGMFTGSGMPMRFADRNGNPIDVYQVTTQLPDENTWVWPADIDTLLDNALGPLGYYGVFTANMHNDFVTSEGSDAIVASAQARGVPIVNSLQMLQWLDGRNTSSFGSLSWNGHELTFTITAGPGARNLLAMLPMNSNRNTLAQLLLNGAPVTFTTQVIKGVTYAFFPASNGSYQALYTDPPQFELGLSATSLSFASQKVSTASAVQTITLSSTREMAVVIGGIAITGANAADFFQTNNCGASLAPGGTCAITVTFTPSAVGSRTAMIQIVDNTLDSPHSIAASGIGGIPALSLGSTAVAFGTQFVGTPAAPQAVALTNSGTAVVDITGIGVTGTNSADFSQTSSCGISLAPGATCSLDVNFTPSATGSRVATIQVTDNADDSPQSISLSGTGGVPSVALGSAAVAFSAQQVGISSAPQSITLTNSGTVALNITGIAVSGANSADFSQTNTCSTSVAAGGTCSVNVTFNPSATGSRTATIGITDNASDSPQSIALSGMGVMPVASLGSTALEFGTQFIGATSSAQAVTLTNRGTAVLNVTGIVLGGANSADFSQTSTCATALAPGEMCSINVTFTPDAIGNRTATITIHDNASDSPQVVSLEGRGMDISLAIVSGSSATQTVLPGQTATYNLQFVPAGGAAADSISATITCAGAPALATCSPSPSTATATAANPAIFSVAVRTTGSSWNAANLPRPGPGTPARELALLASFLPGLMMLTWPGMKRSGLRTRLRRVCCWLPLAAVIWLVGCGGGSTSAPTPSPYTPAGNYSLTVTVTAGTRVQSTQLSLIVR